MTDDYLEQSRYRLSDLPLERQRIFRVLKGWMHRSAQADFFPLLVQQIRR
jgi:hypothetical protein